MRGISTKSIDPASRPAPEVTAVEAAAAAVAAAAAAAAEEEEEEAAAVDAELWMSVRCLTAPIDDFLERAMDTRWRC